MSFDIFMQAFRYGDAADGDGEAALSVVSPLITARDGDWARLTTADGGCDVNGLDEPASGLMFNHASGDAIWSVMFDVARLGGFAVMPVGCPTCVPPGLVTLDLPEDLTRNVEMIASGDDLRGMVGAPSLRSVAGEGSTEGFGNDDGVVPDRATERASRPSLKAMSLPTGAPP